MGTAPLLAALFLLLPSGAGAAPTELTVRIEGPARTLFEGPILSDGHDLQASSDGETRHCDGTNGGADLDPGPTPTASAVDAMGLVGQGFDGRWYSGFDDYLITRWGPDAEDAGTSAFWGVLVNGMLLPVGGCQWRDHAGDEVLWAYDAFTGRKLLRLAAASDPSQVPQAPAPTAAVEVGHPLELRVESYSGGEGEEPEVDPAAGVSVAPVSTEAASGYQTVEVASPDAATTAVDGTAIVSFDSVGWRRLKAQEEDGYIRSNRLDVCVEPVGGGGCGPPPADGQPRVPERYLASATPPAGSPLAWVGVATGVAGNAVLGLGQIKLNRRTGTATVRAVVSSPGRLRLSGRGIRPFALEAVSGGSVSLEVRPGGRARRALRRSGRFPVNLRVAFSAVGGTVSKRRQTVLRLQADPGP